MYFNGDASASAAAVFIFRKNLIFSTIKERKYCQLHFAHVFQIQKDQ